MWGQKFGFVMGSALTFPFKHFSKVKNLYFITALIAFILLALIILAAGGGLISINQFIEVHANPENMEQLGFGMLMLMFFGAIIAIFAILPLMVGVIRTAVTGEEAEPAVLSVMFKRRQLQFIWAYIKIVFVVIAIGLIGLVLGTIIGYLTYAILGKTVGWSMFSIIMFLTFIAAFIVIVRLYLLMVLAALDKGIDLKQARELSKGHWWLIFLTIFLISIVVAIAQWLLFALVAFILTPLALIIPTLLVFIVVILYLLIWLLTMMPQLAALGYLYLVTTNQVKLVESKIKNTAKTA